MKQIGNELYQTHYRTQSIQSLYESFKYTHNINISLSSFANFLPSWLRVRHRYTGLCKTCFIAYFYAKQLRSFRNEWHKNCMCPCTMCTQCDHGVSFNFDCNLGKCDNCCTPRFVNCPLEWQNNNAITYNQISFVKSDGSGTGNRQKIEAVQTTVRKFVKFWFNNLVEYIIHANHVEFHKKMLLKLAHHKDPSIARIHIDFIQNLVITTHDTIQSQHFAAKQITLLVITSQW